MTISQLKRLFSGEVIAKKLAEEWDQNGILGGLEVDKTKEVEPKVIEEDRNIYDRNIIVVD